MARALSAIFAGVLFLLNVIPVAAGPFEDADAAQDKHDYATALRLFRLLAHQGDPNAQYRLGLMYERGQSVPQDSAEAAAWYRRAADQGLKTAQWTLGSMYQIGSGVEQDYVKAYMWYYLSATQGWRGPEFLRAQLEKVMTPDQIAEAQKLAREWKPTK
jgi:TPR repeat protein